ncbi:MAG: ribosome recycling factor [Acutalibacteraceae bacterium]
MKELLELTEQKMQKSVEHLRGEYANIRAGRANPMILDKIRVDYYGTPTPVNQMAAVSVAEARILQIQPWDVSALKLIVKAIQASDIGINPTDDGKVIRLVFPQLTEERRKELTKETAKLSEDAKVAVRAIRRDSIESLKTMKKDNEITEDDQKNGETKIQNITDKYVKIIDEVAAEKNKEIMAI